MQHINKTNKGRLITVQMHLSTHTSGKNDDFRILENTDGCASIKNVLHIINKDILSVEQLHFLSKT